MLDLDSLAMRKSADTHEPVDAWKKCVWSADFQAISASMSDGEVEALFDICPSVQTFEKLTQFLKVRSAELSLSPFAVLEQESSRAGLSPALWIKSLAGAK